MARSAYSPPRVMDFELVRSPVLADEKDVPIGIPGVGGGIVRLQRDRLRQILPGARETLPFEAGHQRDRSQHQVIGRRVHVRPRGAAPRLDEQNFRVDLGHHFGRDLILHRQQIMRLAIEPPRPHHLIAGPQVEQPHRDAQPLAIALDRPVQQKIIPNVFLIAVSSRLSWANRVSELEDTTNIQRNRDNAVVISSARPGPRWDSSSVNPMHCIGSTPTCAPPRGSDSPAGRDPTSNTSSAA